MFVLRVVSAADSRGILQGEWRWRGIIQPNLADQRKDTLDSSDTEQEQVSLEKMATGLGTEMLLPDS